MWESEIPRPQLLIGFLSGFAVAGALLAPVPWPLAVLITIVAACLLLWQYAQRHPIDTRLLGEAIEAMPIPIAIYDRNERLIAHNALYETHHTAAFARLAQRSRAGKVTYAELLDASIDPDVPEPERARIRQEFIDAQPPADGQLTERLFPRVGWLRIGKRTLSCGGTVRVAIEINELKAREAELELALERAKDADSAKTAFLAKMTHELRTPLNGTIGISSLLLRDALSDAQKRNVEMIRQSGQHLLELINRLLDYAKLSHRHYEAEMGWFDVHEVVEEAVSEARCLPQADDLEIGIRVQPHLARRRFGDRLGLRQILTNLLGNAVKFTTAGEVTATLSGGRDDVTIAVRDTGIGLSDALKEKLFEPFVQGDDPLVRETGGTGLGLAITTEIVAAHGGTITVENPAEGGTSFVVYLPLSSQAEQHGQPLKAVP
ncbi:MAG: HAMP domain-containing sensor histidine kinase [Pseudomonadota bacterium]